MLEVESLTLKSKGSSIITELTSHKINKLIGHFPFILHDQHGEKINVITKVKPLDEEVILMVNSMAAMCNPRLAQAFNTFRHQLDFKGCHIRELGVMSQQDPALLVMRRKSMVSWLILSAKPMSLLKNICKM